MTTTTSLKKLKTRVYMNEMKREMIKDMKRYNKNNNFDEFCQVIRTDQQSSAIIPLFSKRGSSINLRLSKTSHNSKRNSICSTYNDSFRQKPFNLVLTKKHFTGMPKQHLGNLNNKKLRKGRIKKKNGQKSIKIKVKKLVLR
jgi:hypothetical protein